MSNNVNDIETKGQTFRYRSLLSERKQNVMVWSANYWNESRTYWFGLKIVLGKVERFYLIQKLIDRSKRFWFGLLIIGMKAEQFDLVCLLSELKQNILIWSAYYRNWVKHFDFVCLLSERKQNVLIGLLIIGTKAKQFDLLHQRRRKTRRNISFPSSGFYVHNSSNFINT